MRITKFIPYFILALAIGVIVREIIRGNLAISNRKVVYDPHLQQKMKAESTLLKKFDSVNNNMKGNVDSIISK
jgi:hypothetical protein